MDAGLLIKGTALGFSIAAPVGPVGLLCIRRTLAGGRLAGFVSGLGAATADAVYGCLAGFGLTFVTSLLVGEQRWLRLVGGLFLCYLGTKTLMTEPAKQAATAKENGLIGAYVSTFFVTFTNPLTILSFAAVFAGMGLAEESRGYFSALSLIFGVLAGSALWWFFLCGIVGLFRNKLGPRGLKRVNTFAGLLIAAFGGTTLFGLLR